MIKTIDKLEDLVCRAYDKAFCFDHPKTEDMAALVVDIVIEALDIIILPHDAEPEVGDVVTNIHIKANKTSRPCSGIVIGKSPISSDIQVKNTDGRIFCESQSQLKIIHRHGYAAVIQESKDD